MTEISAEYIRMMHPLDLEPADIAAHIDAQDAKIKALVEALEKAGQNFYEIANQINDEDYVGIPKGVTGTVYGHREEYHVRHVEYCCQCAEAALAAAKETT